jgi:hypothetical protein
MLNQEIEPARNIVTDIVAPNKSKILLYLNDFLKHIKSEDFIEGRAWAVEAIGTHFSKHYIEAGKSFQDALYETEKNINYKIPEPLPEMPDELAFLMYAGSYMAARCKIEQSYRYLHAHKLIDDALTFLRTCQNASPLLPILAPFSQLQDYLSEIERACYNSDDVPSGASGLTRMKEAAEGLLSSIGTIRSRGDLLTGNDLVLYREYLAERLEAHAVYADAVKQIADLNRLRWTDREAFLSQHKEGAPRLTEKRNRIAAHDSMILENDLAPQIEVLNAFSSLPLTAQQAGELRVRTGQVEFAFYALPQHNLRRKIDAAARGDGTDSTRGKGWFAALHAEPGIDEPLSDIWAGFEAEKLIDSFSWRLPKIIVDFRGRPIPFETRIRYFNFGLFAVTFQANFSDLPVSAVRHLASLGSPITLDEELTWEIPKEERAENPKFGAFEDFARQAFKEIETEIARIFEVPTGESAEPVLTCDPILNRFTAVRADRLVLSGANAAALSPEQSIAHPAFKALTIPAFEVRCAIDDWIMRDAPDPSCNLAPLRYYSKGDALYTCRHEGANILLSQPNWVRDQTGEAMQICAAITNFFCMTNALFNKRVRNIRSQDMKVETDGESNLEALKRSLRQTRTELAELIYFEREVEELLDIMEAGRVMRFPDLTQLVDRMLDNLGTNQITEQTRSLLSQAREMEQGLLDQRSQQHELLKAEIAKEVEARRHERTAFFKYVATSILGVAALVPIIEVMRLLNGAGLGFVINPLEQLIILSSALGFVVICLVLGWSRRGS